MPRLGMANWMRLLKYVPAEKRPILTKGSSAGWPPSSVRIKKAAKNCQVMFFRIQSTEQLTDHRPTLKQGTAITITGEEEVPLRHDMRISAEIAGTAPMMSFQV